MTAAIVLVSGARAQQLIRRAAASAPKVGEPAPPLGLEGLLQAPPGTNVTWEALKGKAVVLEFWATWCGPCVAAIPHLNKLAEEFASKPVQFIAITNEPKDKIERFLKKKSMRAWIGLDTDRSTAQPYGVRAIPRTVLVDANGKVAGIIHPNHLDESALSALLAGKHLEPKSPGARSGIGPLANPAQFVKTKPPLFQVMIRPTAGVNPGTVHRGRGKLTALGYTLPMAISVAYGLPARRVVASSDLPQGEYDVAIVLPAGREDALQAHLRSALETTFGLRTRRETREVDGYALTRLEGQEPRLVPTAMNPSDGSSFNSGSDRLNVTNNTLEAFASRLADTLACEVFNDTKIEGRYDFDLHWQTGAPESVVAAVRAQLGLDLRPVQRSVEVLVVGTERATPGE